MPRSVNKAMFPQCGTMWSTSVALLRIPDLLHSRHQGSAASCDGRRSRIQISSLYSLCQFLAASLRCSDRCGLCLSQYPSGTSAAHPGCRHGLKGFVPMGYHLQGKNKAPSPTTHDKLVQLLATARNAQAFDIQNYFAFTVLATKKKMLRLCSWRKLNQRSLRVAIRTANIPICCHYYTTAVFIGQ